MRISPSGKYYIGQTRNLVTRNKGFHRMSAPYGGPLIEAARKKYSPASWGFAILAEVSYPTLRELVDALNVLESSYVLWFGSNNPRLGYNLTDGGGGLEGHPHTEETCRKISEKKKGYKHGPDSFIFSESYRETMRRACTGRQHTRESRLKMSRVQGGTSVLVYDKYSGAFIDEFASAVEAASFIGVHPNNLYRGLSANSTWYVMRRRGYVCAYGNKGLSHTSLFDDDFDLGVYNKSKRGEVVRSAHYACYDATSGALLQVLPTIDDIVSTYGVDREAVRRVVSSGSSQHRAGGIHVKRIPFDTDVPSSCATDAWFMRECVSVYDVASGALVGEYTTLDAVRAVTGNNRFLRVLCGTASQSGGLLYIYKNDLDQLEARMARARAVMERYPSRCCRV